MRKLLFLIIAACLFLPSWGQFRDVPGIVVSDNDFPVKNIKLSVINDNTTAKTNKKGLFVLKKVSSEDTIVVHISKNAYVKFNLGNKDSMKIVLSDNIVRVHQGDNVPIEAPVQTGALNIYETRAMSVITAKMIERRSVLSVAEAIKTMAPGVNIQNRSGELIVTMRGNKSFTLPQDALIILDGMETSFDQANGISIYEVDYIEINKDGIGYGVKGANGVVIIKTKNK